MKREKSESLFKAALELFPGGVNSPVRAFKSVGGTPIFFEKGEGARVWDVDGNSFIDFCCSWGPLILGHAPAPVVKAVCETASRGSSFGAPTQLENDLASLILEHHRYIEKIRFVSSGTEAVMSAIRLARGFTGRNKVLKFEGCYHGHVDGLLVKAGSGLATLGTSSSAGIPQAYAAETVVVPLNDVQAVKEAFHTYGDDIACVIIEPVPANNGLLLQDGEFLKFLREICDAHKSLLIFDEVISGFRVGFEGAAGLYDIRPDIITFGKIIGGGMPVGAYGGKKEIMNMVAPQGPVYQAGTLSGNPVAMAAGIAQLKQCLKPGFYNTLQNRTEKLVSEVSAFAQQIGLSFHMFSCGSIFWVSFSEQKSIRRSDEIDPSGMSSFAVFHHALLERGIYLGPSGYEVGFVSMAHEDDMIDFAIKAMCEALVVVKSVGSDKHH